MRVLQTRLDTIGSMIKSLYEDKAAGKLPEDIFQNLIADYGVERAELEGKRPTLYKQLGDSEDLEAKVSEWVKRVSAHVDVQTLDRGTISELVDHIEISEIIKDGKKEQEITIRYRFVSRLLPKTKESIA